MFLNYLVEIRIWIDLFDCLFEKIVLKCISTKPILMKLSLFFFCLLQKFI